MQASNMLQDSLKKHFGFSNFKPKQQEIIQSVMDNHNTFVIMPTGGGKSICFQLPALLFDGLTLVISPLIALMKDQVDGLKANGIEADFYNSSQETEEQTEIFEKIYSKKLKLLYVAPESLSYLENILTSLRIFINNFENRFLNNISYKTKFVNSDTDNKKKLCRQLYLDDIYKKSIENLDDDSSQEDCLIDDL